MNAARTANSGAAIEPNPAPEPGDISEFSAAFPPIFTILGTQLLPLSLGRYRLMKWAGVAFVAEEEAEATVEDLFTGIAICAMPCSEFCGLIRSGKLQRTLERWGKKLRKQIRRTPGFNIYEKIALFQKYILQGQKMPWIALPVQSSSPPDYTHTHWSNSLEVVLRGQLGWSKEEIDEQPLTKAFVDYFKYLEGQGQVRLMPPALYGQMMEEGRDNAATLEKLFAEVPS